MTLPRILVVDDQYAHNATERNLFLQRCGIPTERSRDSGGMDRFAEVVFCSGQIEEQGRLVNDYSVVRQAVTPGGWSLVLVDLQFDSGALTDGGRPTGQPGDDVFGLSIRRQLASEFPQLAVVMLTGKRQSEVPDDGTPYLSKQGLGSYELRRAVIRFGVLDGDASRRVLGLEEGTCAEDPGSLAAFRQTLEHARSNVSILLLGESGVGKEVLARYVHRMSERHKGPFIAVNVAAIPRDLVESDLFGMGKGKATGVDAGPGKFEIASGGTLFLDEIGDMPLDTQSKVLRALQERVLLRVGESKEIPFDVRLVCATSKDLGELVKAGDFRGDLYYRINTVPVTMPPLRDRPRDIGPMARAFLARFGHQQRKAELTLAGEATALLERHTYPGNVRELQNLIERLVSSAGNHQVIGERDVGEALGRLIANSSSATTESTVFPGQQIETIPTSGIGAIPSKPQKTGRVGEVSSDNSRRGADGVTLDAALSLLERVIASKDDAALRGAKPRLEAAARDLLRRLAGAALERCRDPLNHTLNRQSAMRLLTGDDTLKGKGPARVVNELLSRGQDHPVVDADLESLVKEWLDASGSMPKP